MRESFLSLSRRFRWVLERDRLRPLVFLAHSDASFARPQVRRLELAGYDVAVCLRPRRAFREIRILRPRVILAGLDMPGCSGLHLHDALLRSARTADIPLLIWTRRDRQTTAERIALLDRELEFFPEDASSDELALRVRNAIRRTQLRAEEQSFLGAPAGDLGRQRLAEVLQALASPPAAALARGVAAFPVPTPPLPGHGGLRGDEAPAVDLRCYALELERLRFMARSDQVTEQPRMERYFREMLERLRDLLRLRIGRGDAACAPAFAPFQELAFVAVRAARPLKPGEEAELVMRLERLLRAGNRRIQPNPRYVGRMLAATPQGLLRIAAPRFRICELRLRMRRVYDADMLREAVLEAFPYHDTRGFARVSL